MIPKLILALVMAGTIGISEAGNAHSKKRASIKIPSADALRDRGLALSIDVERLTRLGIFDEFAGKEIDKSQIEQLVDDALVACWTQHVKTTGDQISQARETECKNYEKECEKLRAVVVKILLLEDSDE